MPIKRNADFFYERVDVFYDVINMIIVSPAHVDDKTAVGVGG